MAIVCTSSALVAARGLPDPLVERTRNGMALGPLGAANYHVLRERCTMSSSALYLKRGTSR